MINFLFKFWIYFFHFFFNKNVINVSYLRIIQIMAYQFHGIGIDRSSKPDILKKTGLFYFGDVEECLRLHDQFYATSLICILPDIAAIPGNRTKLL